MKEYTCYMCGETYPDDWTEEESYAEFERNFGRKVDITQDAVVCDDCFNKIGLGGGIQ